MGNKLTIINETVEMIYCRVRIAGSKETNDSENSSIRHYIPPKNKKIFRSLRTKTYIVFVGEINRIVVSNNYTLYIQAIFNKEVLLKKKVLIKKEGKKTIEGTVMNVLDDNTLTKYVTHMNSVNDIISLIYKFILKTNTTDSFGNKDLDSLGREMLIRIGNGYDKDLRSKIYENSSEIVNLNSIYYILIGIARAIQYDNPINVYITSHHNKGDVQFLYGQLERIINTDLIPSLEHSFRKKSIGLYIISLGLVYYIFWLIEQLTGLKKMQKEFEYKNMLLEKFKELCENFIEGVKMDCTIIKIGRLHHKSILFYKKRHIFEVINLRSRNSTTQIEDIKNVFIENKINQMNNLFNNPLGFIDQVKKVLEFDENEYVSMNMI